MQIYGLDFTSAPTQRKPITCAAANLANDLLKINSLTSFSDFAAFETFLRQPGPWLAGLDFPFGQPRQLVQYLGWPDTWEGYVQEVARLGKSGFGQILATYRRSHPRGEKQPLRATDDKAKSRSPMMWSGVPVGRMFFKGAPRLLESGVNIQPCRPNADTRMVIEAYPALVAHRWAGSYKSDTKKKQTHAHEAARRAIVEGVRSEQLQANYGFSLELSDTITEDLVQEPTGDRLDAVLCAIQAAWAYRHNFVVPTACHSLEGWIFDPKLV